jgi:hypothetical protein
VIILKSGVALIWGFHMIDIKSWVALTWFFLNDCPQIRGGLDNGVRVIVPNRGCP